MSTRLTNMAGAILSLAALLTITSGCELLPMTRSAETAGPVSTAWEQTLRDVGFVAVWPPREDVRVGDFYVFPVNPEASLRVDPTDINSRKISALTRWGSLAMVSELQAEYQNRPSWPITPEAYLQTGDPAERREWHGLLDADRSILEPRETTRRLRLIGLDVLPASTYTEGNLNALVPAEVFNIVHGSGWGDPKAVILKPGPAETYGIPLSVIAGRLLDEQISGGARHFFLKPEFQRQLALAGRDNVIWVQIVTEVLYIRTADVTVAARLQSDGDQELRASELQSISETESDQPAVQLAEPAEAAATAGAAASPTVVAATSPAEDDTLDPIYGAFARAQAINRVMMESNMDRVPGSIVRFLSVTDESVSIRRIWQHGLAVGVRGLTLEVDRGTGKVLRVGPMGVPLPEDEPEEAKDDKKK